MRAHHVVKSHALPSAAVCISVQYMCTLSAATIGIGLVLIPVSFPGNKPSRNANGIRNGGESLEILIILISCELMNLLYTDSSLIETITIQLNHSILRL